MATRHHPLSPAFVTLAGFLSLAIAMGIGRFGFTPQLALMVQEGQLDVAQGGWLAAANYVGYLVGALTASRLRANASALALASLAAVAVSTAAMGLPGLTLWAVLRFVAGVTSAWVFVATSVWCLGALAKQQRTELGMNVYAGVGIGIAIIGIYCLVAAVAGVRTQVIWLHLGVLAAIASVPVFLVARSMEREPMATPASAASNQPLPKGTAGLILSYAIMGFGYILPATFLPVLARSVITDPAVFGLAWPVFGATAALSTVVASVWMRRVSRLQMWATCQALMGLGTLLPSIWAHAISFLLSAVLVGGTFLVITFASVQEIRERVTWNTGVWVGYLTAAFAAGQIAGPVVTALLLSLPGIAEHALDIGLQAAALSLFVSAVWIWRQTTPTRA